ncbi:MULTISPECIES: DUF484 family protein [Pseudomonas]|uniref:DUF484 family protein n=1 Tax=Pseudomonas quercus TaxID=2722792 RepID=A0ABX0YF12_9PSED|nr:MULTISPECIES: DUF484 family protein [Pseudomonas]MBF7142309.1 DUF484 family protein [Pseudomonas sp. LY10J]NJP00847.1 DUF484 family protein [Pseudomonas quercus]
MSHEPDTKGEVDAAAVVAYLEQHPSFFVDHQALLATLHIPHQRGDTISLVEHQLALLRGRNTELRQRLAQLMDVARDNDRLFDKTRRLMLELLDATSLEEVVMAMDDSLRQSFKVPFVSLVLFTDVPTSVGRSVTLGEAQHALGALLADPRPVTGVLRQHELEFLFGTEHPQVASTALAPLVHQGVIGVLAIGSSDADHYKSSVGTLFLAHIAEVLSRVLPRFTSMPRPVR